MAQGILPFIFEAAPQPMDLTAHAGLTLVSETMLALGLDRLVGNRLRVRERSRGYDEFDKLHAIVLVQAAGGECVEDVRVLARDAGLLRLVDRPLPSPDALHDFLAAFHDEAEMARRPAEGAWVPAENEALRALAAVNVELVRRAVGDTAVRRGTLDLDATLIESHKRDALPHYQGGRGYQPTVVLWAEEDLVVADEYRDGNVPAGRETLPLIRSGFASLPASVTEYAFRADSACYDERVLKWLANPHRPGGPAGPIRFTISADMTQELRQACAAPGPRWELLEDRVIETVEVTEIVFTPGDWSKRAAPLRYVALRIRPKQGHLFADSTKYLAVVSNRWEIGAAALVQWHWEKAGTIELIHDVTKNDLAAGVPPSGKFGANAAWYRLTLLTYNVLTVLRRRALPERFRHARPRRLRYEVFTVPAEIRSHARQLTARLGAPPLTVEELVAARGRLRNLRSAVRAAVASRDP
jgi:hypothetical protein